MSSKQIIGIAGYMGSGKSSLSHAVASELKAKIIDVDVVARSLMLEDVEIINKVGDRFGVVYDGKIDFASLGPIVFAEKAALNDLNTIVHPRLITLVNEMSNALAKESIVIIDCALLTLWEKAITYDYSIWVEVSQKIRVGRVSERNSVTTEVALGRICAQMEMVPKGDSNSEHWHLVNNESDLKSGIQSALSIIEDF